MSRSAVVTRKTCERKRFWNYHAQPFGREATPGIVPKASTPRSELPRVRGQIFHEAAALLFEGKPWHTFVDESCATRLHPDVHPREQAALIRRALLGWSVVRAEVLADYTVVSAEQEWTWALTPDLHQSLRLDRILRRNDDGTLLIFDFKTMKSPDPNWVERLQNSEQTHLYIQALKERSAEWVMGMMYDGLIIGGLDDDGHQKSPFVRAYRKRDGSLSAKYVAGAPSVSTLDWSDQDWLTWAQESHILGDLYCTTGPLLPPSDQLLTTKANTIGGELRWADRMAQLQLVATEYGEDSDDYQEALATLVEKNPDACLKYGREHACPYHALCWTGTLPDTELFEPREDHHA